MYYDKSGKKIELTEWCRLLEDNEYRIIKQEILSNGKMVSTVWLGLDHSFDDDKILIFETMVFSKKGNYEDPEMKKYSTMERYSTLEEAKEGHKKMVKNLMKD